MRHSSWIAIALSSVALTACAAGNPRTIADQHVTYTYGDYLRVADGRDMQVIVRGTPFALSQPDFDRLVMANMAARPGGARTNYTNVKTTNADPNYEVVWLFNGPMAVQADELCNNPTAVTGQSGPAAQLRVLAAFCRFNHANSWVEGWLDGGPQGVPREGVNMLVQQMTRELFPSNPKNDPRRDSGDKPNN